MSAVASIQPTIVLYQRRSLWIGAVVLILCAMGAGFHPEPFFRAYLAAYLFYLGIALGSMAMLMVYNLTGGSWGLLVRRILEAAMKTLPLLALLFLPIGWGVRYLYVWAQPEIVAASPKLQYQQFYLEPTLFWLRAALYFALWLGMAFLLAHWSRQEDQAGDSPRLAWKRVKLSGLGAVVYGVSLHFAAVDWGMSLVPVFHSTIWGPIVAAGQLLSALCFALVVLAWLIDRPPLAEVASRGARNDLGSLLLTLVCVWAYMAWFQFMLIWIANLPADVVWYLPRTSPGWQGVIWLVIVFHFVIPFFLLLFRPVKRNSVAVGWIAAVILFMQLVFMYYQIVPGLSVDTLLHHAMDLLLPLGLGGLWLAHFLGQLQKMPLLAPHDDNRAAALRLLRLDEEEAAREEAIAYE